MEILGITGWLDWEAIASSITSWVFVVHSGSGMEWLMNGAETPAPSKVGLMAGLIAIMGLSIISAVSGVGRGVKYLSNLNLVLSFILLATFVLAGSFLFAMSTYISALLDYILNFVQISFVSYTTPAFETFQAGLPEAVRALPAAS